MMHAVSAVKHMKRPQGITEDKSEVHQDYLPRGTGRKAVSKDACRDYNKILQKEEDPMNCNISEDKQDHLGFLRAF